MPSQRQHFVPEFLLRGFTAPDRKKLYGFDKQENKIFETTPEKAAKENGYYDFDTIDGKGSLEPALTDLETQAAPLIQKKLLLTHRTLDLTKEEKTVLALFLAVQLVRDKNSRAMALDAWGQVREHLKGLGVNPKAVKGFEDPSDEEMRMSSLSHIAAAPQYAPHLADKNWAILLTPPNTSLYISDSPITLENERTFGFLGNLGIAVPGIQISLPLSRSVNLWLTCKSIEQDFRAKYQTAALSGIPAATPPMRKLRQMLDIFSGAQAHVMTNDHVMRFNSLQVTRCERFIYSSSNDFSTAQKLLEMNPHFKTGHRIKVG